MRTRRFSWSNDRTSLALFAFLVPLVLLTAVGCGQSAPSIPVVGKVVVDSNPEAGIYVTLRHESSDEDIAPTVVSARTEADGKFQAVVPVAGTYQVSCYWPSVVTDDDIPMEGPDQLQGRYQSQDALPSIEVTETGADAGTLNLESSE